MHLALSIQAKIRSQAKDEMTKSQKEYFLREQIRAIKSELGDTDAKGEEIVELRDKVAACKMPHDVEQEALKQQLQTVKKSVGQQADEAAKSAFILRGYKIVEQRSENPDFLTQLFGNGF